MGAAVGDEVIGGDGKPCRVTWVSPVWTGRECYAVTTGDGEQIVADAAHEWVAKLDRRRSTRIVETADLAKPRLKAAQITAPHHGLDLPDADLPLDPYVLGVWLGDGTTGQAAITCHPDDAAIRDRFAEAGWPLRHTGRLHWTMAPDAPNGTWGRGNPTPAKAALRAAGVLTDKHIPPAYLRASRAQRLALLQGLIDSDGYVMPKGQVEFCSVKRQLADDVRELVYSLGAKAVTGVGRATMAGRDCGPKSRVRFYLADAAHLPRKAVHCKDSSVSRVRYVRATPCESVPTVCIEVDSDDHTFLAGRTMLPTHNSVRAATDFPTWLLARRPDTRIIVASYGQTLATRNGRAIRNRIIGNPALGLRIAPDNGAASQWTIDGHTGGVYAVSIGSGVSGWACDAMIIDDPIKSRAEADSETFRQRVWDWWTDEASTRLSPGAPVALILTRWHHDDLAGRLLAEPDSRWKVLNIPAQCDDMETDPLGRKAGEFMLSTRGRTRAQWEIRKAAVGPRAWASLFQGRPTPDQGNMFPSDVRTAWNRIAPAYAGKPVAILGRSLGTGLATRLARDVKPDLLVLVSPYASLLRLAREHYPSMPRALFKYPLESDRLIAAVTSPVLILHGRNDALIPVAHAQARGAACGGGAELLPGDGAGHDDIQDFAAYRDALARSLADLGGLPLKADRRY